jgi:hypothetical protein
MSKTILCGSKNKKFVYSSLISASEITTSATKRYFPTADLLYLLAFHIITFLVAQLIQCRHLSTDMITCLTNHFRFVEFLATGNRKPQPYYSDFNNFVMKVH